MTEKEIREVCRERNIKITRVGSTWRLSGAGVSLLVSNLTWISERDLQSVHKHPLRRAEVDRE